MLDYRSSARFRRPGVVRASADDHITHRVLRGDVVVLVQIADRQRSRAHDPAGIRFGPAGEDAQQRALAVTVTPDYSDDLTAAQAEAHSDQQGPGAVRDGDALGVDQIRHRGAGPTG